MAKKYSWTDNPTVSGVATCDTDILNDCLMHLKYENKNTLTTNCITNCITEIPQDIKLELNNGVLTLKAGSKVYVPNGFEADGTTKKFDEIIIENDVVRDIRTGTENSQAFIFYKPSEQIIDIYDIRHVVSGDTDILATSTYHAWYDTNNNLCKIIKDNLSSYALFSLPIALCTRTNGNISSIDQVFNGFGYIGSTVFVLPNVKGLAPNGRNEDGTLKNVSWQTKTVLTAPAYKGTYLLSYNPETEKSIINIAYNANYAEADTLPQWSEGRNSGDWLNTYDNIMYKIDDGVVSGKEINQGIPTAVFTLHAPTSQHANPVTDPTQITGITYKLPFRALDYSDKSVVSSWSFPSKKYIDLAVGASGTNYIAPANGWFYAYCSMSSTDAYLDMSIGTIYKVRLKDKAWNSSDIAQIVPVKKGGRLILNYLGMNFYAFRFIYAEGEV